MENQKIIQKEQKDGGCNKKKAGCNREPNLWKSGDPLTSRDLNLLSVLKRKYKQLGYVPSQKEVPNSAAIKKRFGTWADAVAAAGLPRQNDASQKIRHQEKSEWEKRMAELLR